MALVGSVVPAQPRIGAATIAAWVIAAGALFSPRRLPEMNRETKQSLLHQGPLQWAALNGALLGIGFTSRIGYWVWYLIPLTCFIASSPETGAALWGTYAFTRLAIIFVLSIWMRREPMRMSEAGASLVMRRDLLRTLLRPTGAILALSLGAWLAY